MEIRKYCVMIKNEDGLIVNVKDDVNRPNNEDCDSVLERWISENYGDRDYDYFEINHAEVIEL